MVTDRIGWKAQWDIDRFENEGALAAWKPYSHSHIDGNLGLNEGIEEALNLIIGDAGATPFDNANAYLGVGTSDTAAGATDTGLLAGPVYVAMDLTYPQVSGTSVVFRSTFDGTTANQSWQEFTVANGVDDDATNLNRKVSDQSAKVSGQIWVLTLTITMA